MSITRIKAAFSFTTLALIMALGLSAPTSAQPPASAQTQVQPSGDYSDSQLLTFVELQEELEMMRTEYVSQLEATNDQVEAQALQAEANRRMVETVQSSDLSVEVYNEISVSLRQDQALRERVEQLLN